MDNHRRQLGEDAVIKDHIHAQTGGGQGTLADAEAKMEVVKNCEEV